MSSAVPATILNGMSLLFYTSATTNAVANVSIMPSYASPPANVYQGATVVGAGIDPNTYVWEFGSIAFTHPPSATFADGQTIYFCNGVTTSADSAAGQPNINFATTTWPNRLLLIRMNWASANVPFFGETSNALANAANLPGTPLRMFGGRCAFGTDGVLNVSAISDTGGSCSEVAPWAPVWAIRTYSPRRGITLAVVGDSHFEGDTTPSQLGSFAARAAALLNRPSTLPVSLMNLAWGGQPSYVYGPKAMQMIQSSKPEIVVIQQTTPNDTSSASAIASMQATAESIADYVRSYGGLPVLAPDYQRQTFGCSTVFPASDALRLNAETLLLSAAKAGTPVIDLPSFIGDPVNGATFFAPGASYDCIHANDNGHALMAGGLAAALKRYLRY